MQRPGDAVCVCVSGWVCAQARWQLCMKSVLEPHVVDRLVSGDNIESAYVVDPEAVSVVMRSRSDASAGVVVPNPRHYSGFHFYDPLMLSPLALPVLQCDQYAVRLPTATSPDAGTAVLRKSGKSLKAPKGKAKGVTAATPRSLQERLRTASACYTEPPFLRTPPAGVHVIVFQHGLNVGVLRC